MDCRCWVPDSRGSGPAREGAEVAGFPAESALDAVGRVCVAAVEDLGEQEHEQFDHLAWEALLSKGCGELVNGHGQVADVSAGRRRDLLDGLGEGQQSGSGQLVEFADVSVVGQCSDGDVGDVVCVDKRLGRVPLSLGLDSAGLSTASDVVDLIAFFVLAAIPIAFLIGLLRGRFTQVAVSDLLLELGSAPPSPEELERALAKALRDPSLSIAY